MSYVSKIVKDLVSSVFDGSEFNVTPSKLLFFGVVFSALGSLAYYFRDYLPCCSLKSRRSPMPLIDTDDISERYQLLRDTMKRCCFCYRGVKFIINSYRNGGTEIKNLEMNSIEKVDYGRIISMVVDSNNDYDDDDEVDSVDSDYSSDESSSDESTFEQNLNDDESYIRDVLLNQLKNNKIAENLLYDGIVGSDKIDEGSKIIADTPFLNDNYLMSLLFYRYLNVFLKKTVPNEMNTLGKLADSYSSPLENGYDRYHDQVTAKIHNLAINKNDLNENEFLSGLGMLLSYFACFPWYRLNGHKLETKISENMIIFDNLSHLFAIWKNKYKHSSGKDSLLQIQVIERIINFAELLRNRGLQFSAAEKSSYHDVDDKFVLLGKKFLEGSLTQNHESYEFLEKLGERTFEAFVMSEEESKRFPLDVIKKSYLTGFAESFYDMLKHQRWLVTKKKNFFCKKN